MDSIKRSDYHGKNLLTYCKLRHGIVCAWPIGLFVGWLMAKMLLLVILTSAPVKT